MKRPLVQSLSSVTPKDFGRRMFLRGAGGAAVGMPLLELTAGKARAQMDPPKRVLFMTAGHSVEPYTTGEAWSPAGNNGSPLTGDISDVLSPLAAHRDKLLVVEGIDNIATNLQPTNGHNGTSRTMLSVMPIQKALDSNGNLVPDPPECTVPEDSAGPSIDYFLADAWGENLLSLRVGGAPGEHVRSFRMDLTRDLHEGSPTTAFTRLFRDYTGATQSDLEKLRAKRGSILDNVRGNFSRLVARVGGEDKMRLERHANQIRELEMQLEQVTRVVCDNPTYGGPGLQGINVNDGNGRADDLIAAGHMDLVKTAFSCQATRVAHIHFSNIQVNKFPFLNNGNDLFSIGWHGIIHKDDGTDQQRLQTMQWYMKVMADAIQTLADTPEGDGGSLLDNTLIVWMSSLRQSWHGTYSLPTVIAGDLGGTFNTGRVLKYQSRTTGDFFTTLLNYLDVPAQSFGWTTGGHDGTPFFTGPLPGFDA